MSYELQIVKYDNMNLDIYSSSIFIYNDNALEDELEDTQNHIDFIKTKRREMNSYMRKLRKTKKGKMEILLKSILLD